MLCLVVPGMTGRQARAVASHDPGARGRALELFAGYGVVLLGTAAARVARRDS